MRSAAARRAFHATPAAATANTVRDRFRELGHGTVHLKYHRHLPVALLQLDNPQRRNALSGRMMAELADAVDQLQDDQDRLAAVILTGSPTAFCSGLDLTVAASHVRTPEAGAEMSALMHDTLTRLRRLSIVSVAAVEGHAVGGGAELTTATDLRVVTFGTTVRFVHVKLGAAPGWGGAYRLTQLLGHTKALQLLLSAKKLDGDAAVKIGLAQWVAPSGGALAKAVDVLEGYLGASIPEAAVDAAMDAVRRDRSPLGTDATESTSSASASVDDEDAVAHLAAWHHFTADPTAVPWLASTTAAELGATGYSGHSLDSIRAIKTGVIAAMDLPEAEAMQLERDAFASVWGGEHNVAALGRGRASPPLPPPPSS